jgi:hypothetical protein
MTRPRLCRYCERPDCNDRCSRTELRHRIDRLLELTDELEDGELEMQKELDTLSAEKNALLAKLQGVRPLSGYSYQEIYEELRTRGDYGDGPA